MEISEETLNRIGNLLQYVKEVAVENADAQRDENDKIDWDGHDEFESMYQDACDIQKELNITLVIRN